MKKTISILFAVLCLITIGRAADAYLHGGSVKGDCIALNTSAQPSVDIVCVESEEVIDPVLATCELPVHRHPVRPGSVDSPPYRGRFCGECLTSTPRYIMVRRLLI